MSSFKKVVAGLIVGVGTISGMSAAQAEILDLEDAVVASKNPYVSPSGDFSIQAFTSYPGPFPAARPFTANVNKTSSFNGSTNYLTMNTNPNGAAIVTSTTPGAVFDVSSIDLGSGARFEFTDVTVRALDAGGGVIASATFNNQEKLAEHPLTGFVEMDSLEITSVQSGNTTRTRFSFDNIDITASILVRNIDIDIKPGSDPNSINLCGAGVIPVAIFGSDDFLVSDIVISTLRLGDGTPGSGSEVKMVGKSGKELCSTEDVDFDGYDDLVCKFVTVDLNLAGGAIDATVLGSTTSEDFVGTDSVNIVKDDCG